MHVPAHTMFKAFKAGMCTYLGLCWYMHLTKYVQSVLIYLVLLASCSWVCFSMCMYQGLFRYVHVPFCVVYVYINLMKFEAVLRLDIVHAHTFA